jgi:hypothetical protein
MKDGEDRHLDSCIVGNAQRSLPQAVRGDLFHSHVTDHDVVAYLGSVCESTDPSDQLLPAPQTGVFRGVAFCSAAI